MAYSVGGPPPIGPEPPGLHPKDRRERALVIGLAIAGALVLVVGVLAVALTSGGDDEAVTTEPTTATSDAAQPSTTADTTTSSTSSSTTTTTQPPVAVADAGPDIDADRRGQVTLAAQGLDAAAAATVVRWVQTSGPDVTGGAGVLGGSSVTFTAPDAVSTVAFTLEVDVEGVGEIATDELVVRVFEDADRAVFVDGERGDDSGDGSRAAPFRSIRVAAEAAAGRDVYVRSVGTYDETAGLILLDDDTSLYAGFDADWVRDPDRRAIVRGAHFGIVISGDAERWLSSVELTTVDAPDVGPAAAVVVRDVTAPVHVTDSRIVSGAGGAGTATEPGGTSFGILAERGTVLRIERTSVNAGAGGAGGRGDDAAQRGGSGGDGSSASGRNGGAGGDGEGDDGADGGDGGETSNGSSGGDAGGEGGSGGTEASRNGGAGERGRTGAGGGGGDGGTGFGGGSPFTNPIGAAGTAGAAGAPGAGAGGGGGGFGPFLVAGGGGGGGGAGGTGGPGGSPGTGGGGSVGVAAIDVEEVVLVESLVAGGVGGAGGAGGDGAVGSAGGAGGDGAVGVDGVLADGGGGGGGGGGGAGGEGGSGGGGAGGSSFGLLTNGVAELEVRSTTIRGGGGGAGGDGGEGGRRGGAGGNGSGRDGGGAGTGVTDGERAQQGAGASGGGSYGWFDDSNAEQRFDDATIRPGNPGPGGAGSTPGDPGVAVATRE